jgi:zinc protease
MHIGLGAVGPRRRDPDAEAFAVLSTLLGGALDSALMEDLREEMGLTYGPAAAVAWWPDASLLRVHVALDGDDVLPGTRAVLAQIAALRDAPPTADALDRAKKEAVGSWRRWFESSSGAAMSLATAAVEGEDPQAVLAWPDRVRAVGPNDLQGAARKYLSQPSLRVVVVGRPEFVGTAASLALGPPVMTDFAGKKVGP